MKNLILLRKISYVGLFISGLLFFLKISTIFFLQNNQDGVNFTNGINVPVYMSTWIHNYPENRDSITNELIIARPFDLSLAHCPNADLDIESVRNNKSSVIAQNRIPFTKTELKIKSKSIIVNIFLSIFNLLPSFFWVGLFYLVFKMTRIEQSDSNVTILYSTNLNFIGRYIIFYEMLLFLFSILILFIFGGAAYTSNSSAINECFKIHFHPRIIFNFPEMFLGFGLIWISGILKNKN